MDTRRIINNLAGHPDHVRCLVVNNDKLYSSSRDLIKIWSLQTFENIETLSGHFFMFHLGISEDYLYSGSHNGIIKLWSNRIGSFNRELKLIHGYLENYNETLINVCLRCFLLEEIKSLTYEIM